MWLPLIKIISMQIRTESMSINGVNGRNQKNAKLSGKEGHMAFCRKSDQRDRIHREKVLEKVEWCANCGEICKVKEGEGWRVYGDKHESAARSNYHPFCDKRIPDRLRVRNHGRLKIKERKSLLRAKVNLKGLPTNWRRRLAPKKRDWGRWLSSVTVKINLEWQNSVIVLSV